MTHAVPTVKLLIGGQFVEPKTTQWRDVVNPATQEVLARIPFATPEEMNAAIASAKQAFKTWRKTPIGARAQVFLKYQQLIRENVKELAALMSTRARKYRESLFFLKIKSFSCAILTMWERSRAWKNSRIGNGYRSVSINPCYTESRKTV